MNINIFNSDMLMALRHAKYAYINEVMQPRYLASHAALKIGHIAISFNIKMGHNEVLKY